MTLLRRWLTVIIPATVLLLFAVGLNTGTYLKRPMGGRDDIPGALHRLEQVILLERWSESGTALKAVSTAMTIVRPRIELATERSELQRFEETLGLLSGSLSATDKASALQHVALLKQIYSELGR